MEIPNLATNPNPFSSPVQKPTKLPESSALSPVIALVVALLGVGLGVALNVLPLQKTTASNSPAKSDSTTQETISTDKISDKNQIQVGKVYGNTGKEYSDSATGIIRSGNINGEGTHILEREGGVSQRASLTSSAVDLDLFIDRKVELKGQTFSSTKTGWLLDVGTVKVLE